MISQTNGLGSQYIIDRLNRESQVGEEKTESRPDQDEQGGAVSDTVSFSSQGLALSQSVRGVSDTANQVQNDPRANQGQNQTGAQFQAAQFVDVRA